MIPVLSKGERRFLDAVQWAVRWFGSYDTCELLSVGGLVQLASVNVASRSCAIVYDAEEDALRLDCPGFRPVELACGPDVRLSGDGMWTLFEVEDMALSAALALVGDDDPQMALRRALLAWRAENCPADAQSDPDMRELAQRGWTCMAGCSWHGHDIEADIRFGDCPRIYCAVDRAMVPGELLLGTPREATALLEWPGAFSADSVLQPCRLAIEIAEER